MKRGNTYILDISEKNIHDYVMIGILYAFDIGVITWSNKILSTNVMTACATKAHYQVPEDGELTVNDLFELSLKNSDEFEELFHGKLYNLSNMKFVDKIE